jgi:hypothetical protein
MDEAARNGIRYTLAGVYSSERGVVGFTCMHAAAEDKSHVFFFESAQLTQLRPYSCD